MKIDLATYSIVVFFSLRVCEIFQSNNGNGVSALELPRSNFRRPDDNGSNQNLISEVNTKDEIKNTQFSRQLEEARSRCAPCDTTDEPEKDDTSDEPKKDDTSDEPKKDDEPGGVVVVKNKDKAGTPKDDANDRSRFLIIENTQIIFDELHRHLAPLMEADAEVDPVKFQQAINSSIAIFTNIQKQAISSNQITSSNSSVPGPKQCFFFFCPTPPTPTPVETVIDQISEIISLTVSLIIAILTAIIYIPLQLIILIFNILASVIIGILDVLTAILETISGALSPETRKNQRSRSLFFFEGIITRIFGTDDSPPEISDIIKMADKGLSEINSKAEALEKNAVSSTDDVTKQQLGEAINDIVNAIVDFVVLIIDAIVALILAIINFAFFIIGAVINIFISIIQFFLDFIGSILGTSNSGKADSAKEQDTVAKALQVSFGGVTEGVVKIFQNMIDTVASIGKQLEDGSGKAFLPFLGFVLNSVDAIAGLFIQVGDGTSDDEEAVCQMQSVSCSASKALKDLSK